VSMYGSGTPRPVVRCGPSRARPEFAKECDINNIVARYKRDGFISHLARGVPSFVDVSEVGDFRTAMTQVRAAGEFFEGLPAVVRAKFGNDVARFVDEAGSLTRAELRELGLAELRKDDVKRRASDKEEPAPVEGAGSGTVTS